MCVHHQRSATSPYVWSYRINVGGAHGGDTHPSSLPASKDEDQHSQFYCIFGELSPGISLKKKKSLIYEKRAVSFTPEQFTHVTRALRQKQEVRPFTRPSLKLNEAIHLTCLTEASTAHENLP